MLELLYGSGLRVSECCGIDEDSLDLLAGAVTVWGKGGKQRRVPMTAASVETLRSYLDDAAPFSEPHSPARAVFSRTPWGIVSAREMSGASWTGAHRCRRIPMRCATASPRTCLTAVRTCEWSKSFSGTPAYKPPRPTPMSRKSASSGFIDRRTLQRLSPEEPEKTEYHGRRTRPSPLTVLLVVPTVASAPRPGVLTVGRNDAWPSSQ